MKRITLPPRILCFGAAPTFEELIRSWGLSNLEGRTADLAVGWYTTTPPQANAHVRFRVNDEVGRPRASVYDDSVVLHRRYLVHEHSFQGWTIISAQQKHPLVVLQEFGSCRGGTDSYERDHLRAEARRWLDVQYPLHMNPFAYWDD